MLVNKNNNCSYICASHGFAHMYIFYLIWDNVSYLTQAIQEFILFPQLPSAGITGIHCHMASYICFRGMLYVYCIVRIYQIANLETEYDSLAFFNYIINICKTCVQGNLPPWEENCTVNSKIEMNQYGGLHSWDLHSFQTNLNLFFRVIWCSKDVTYAYFFNIVKIFGEF